jgi:hypothetical protein
MNFGAVLKAFDLMMMAGAAARRLRGQPVSDDPLAEARPSVPASLGVLETKLTGVVVAALKEAFERDHSRLELEREHLEAERRRAEQALRLELRRQAVEGELARLRLLAWVALVGFIGSVSLLAFRVGAATGVARGLAAAGWLLLLGSLASAFTAQQRLSAVTVEDQATPGSTAVPVWLLVGGLGVSAVSLLF